MSKPVLKGQVQRIMTVDYSDLEDFVKQVYKAEDYDFVATEECGNDSQHSFSIDGKISKSDQKDADQIRQGIINSYQNYLLLNTLCADGYIEPGEYLIEVCW